MTAVSPEDRVKEKQDRPKTPVTYNRKDPAEIPILKSLPNVGGSSDGSSVTVVSPEDRPKEQDDNTYINGVVKKMLNYQDLE